MNGISEYEGSSEVAKRSDTIVDRNKEQTGNGDNYMCVSMKRNEN